MKRVKRLYLSVERVDDRVIATKRKNQCTIDRCNEEKWLKRNKPETSQLYCTHYFHFKVTC